MAFSMKDHYITIKIDDLFTSSNLAPPKGKCRERAVQWIESHLVNRLRHDLADLMEAAGIELDHRDPSG